MRTEIVNKMLILAAALPLSLSPRCGHDDFIAHNDPIVKSAKPIVCILPIQNDAGCCQKVTENFSKTLFSRLQKYREFTIQEKKPERSQFFVQIQFIDLQDSEELSGDYILSVHLKVFENSSEKPTLILQEVFTTKTLLESPLNDDLDNEEFEITPLGLASSKLSREIGSRIEEVISSSPRSI